MNVRAIPFNAMTRHVAAAVRCGWPIDQLLAESAIELQHGDRRDSISPEQALLLCMNSVLAAEDAALGMTRANLPASYPAIGATMMLGCVNLETGLQALSRLYASASGAVAIELQTEHDRAVVSVHVDPVIELDAAYLEELFLLWVFMQCLNFLGRDMPVLRVTLRDALHFNLGRQHWGIHGPVRYGSRTEFHFPRTLLGQPSASRAGACVMWECQKRWLEYVHQGPLTPSPTEYVTDNGFVRFSDMVRKSGKSANTLRSQIKSSQGGFRDTRQRTLVDAATAMLRTSDDNVETIAAELGYAEASSFRRFFKRATGLTPQQVREQLATTRAADEASVLMAVKARSKLMSF